MVASGEVREGKEEEEEDSGFVVGVGCLCVYSLCMCVYVRTCEDLDYPALHC